MSENKYEIKDYKSAFECFKQRFLEERKSIFDLNNENEILVKRVSYKSGFLSKINKKTTTKS